MAVLLCAAIVVASSLLVGGLVNRLGGRDAWSWSAGPVGFALLTVVGPPTVHLPGRMGLFAVVVVLLTAVAAVHLVRAGTVRARPWALLAVVPTVLLALLPFAANARFGVLGVAFNNDMAAHLLLADALRSSAVDEVTPLLTYYPLGPHALAGAVGSLAGVDSDAAFTGVILALPVLTATAALAFLGGLPLWSRAIVAALTSMPYLAASYYGQGAFKELTMMLFLLGVAATVSEAPGVASVRRFVPLGVVLAGIVSSYSYLGLAWPAAGLGLVFLVWAGAAVRAGRARAAATWLLRPAVLGGATVLLLLLPQAGRIEAFREWNAATGIRKDDIGNLAGPIDPAEALGVWLQRDFRFAPAETFPTSAWLVLVGVLLVAGAAWWAWRREPVVPCLLLGSAVVWAVSEPGQSPYTVAKALAIASPFVLLIAGRAAFEGRHPTRAALRVLPVALGLLVAGAATWSSVGALRYAQVGATDHRDDLAALRPLIDGRPTLYLGLDDFAAWELRGAPVTQPMFAGAPFALRPEKGWSYGQSYDVDTIEPTSLDRFAVVVAPRNPTASAMPENFRRIASRGVYDLWERRGRTPDREVLAEGQQGTAVLDCTTRDGRRLARRNGVAAVRRPAVVVPLQTLVAGQTFQTQAQLGRGVWDLAVRYTGPRALRLQVGGHDVLLPPAPERAGSVWPAGSVTVRDGAPTVVRTTADRTRLGGDNGVVAATELVAQRRGTERTVPLARACGRAVDWYRTTR